MVPILHGDKVVIINALRTWQEFEEHLALRNRGLLPEAIVDAFLDGGSPAPAWALDALHWLKADMNRTQKKHQQSIVLEPPMLVFLEEKIDPAWCSLPSVSPWVDQFAPQDYQEFLPCSLLSQQAVAQQ